MAHRAECLQRDKQKTQMITKDLSTQGPPKERPGFGANLTMVDHEAHGYPNKITVPCVDRRDTGGKIVINVPFANSQCMGRGDTSVASE